MRPRSALRAGARRRAAPASHASCSAAGQGVRRRTRSVRRPLVARSPWAATMGSQEPDHGFLPELLSLCAEIAAVLLLVVVLIRLLFGADDSSCASVQPEQPRCSSARTNSSMYSSEAEGEAVVLLPVSRASSDNELTILAGTRRKEDKKHRWLAPRHTVVVLTLLANMVCYADRTNISVAIVAMSVQYGWSEVQQGGILGAFFW